MHGVIEFGNRLLTFALTAVVAACLVAVWRARPVRPGMRRLATLVFLGIPAQAVLGGITVLTGLNPWTVMAHFLLSMVLIALAVVLHQRAREGDLPARHLVAPPLRRLGTGLLVLGGVLFPLSAFGPAEPALSLLPTAALSTGLRDVLQDGAVPVREVLVLAGWGAVGLTAASRAFRWE